MRTARIPLELPAPRAALGQLGSTRLTLGLLPALAIAVVAVGQDAGPPAWTLAAPLGLLALNLAAAIAVQGTFRARPALLVFHLALLAVVVLAAAGRLTYLKGSLELSEGEEFAGRLLREESGPLHPRALERAAFTNAGFGVDYEPGLRRARTRNRVAYVDASGLRRVAQIGDDMPLKLAGYRFYTTSNKGFAPEFVWVPASGADAVRGTIHLPSFPAQLADQELAWTPPGTTAALQTRLEMEERIVDLESKWTLRAPDRHVLVVTAGGEERSLRPGQSLRLGEGTLHYAGLRMWMGYSVSYDWTLPWQLAGGVLAAFALAWHLAVRALRESWRAPGAQGRG